MKTKGASAPAGFSETYFDGLGCTGAGFEFGAPNGLLGGHRYGESTLGLYLGLSKFDGHSVSAGHLPRRLVLKLNLQTAGMLRLSGARHANKGDAGYQG